MDFSLIWTISAGTNVDHVSGIGCTSISCVKFSWTTLYTIVRKLRVRKFGRDSRPSTMQPGQWPRAVPNVYPSDLRRSPPSPKRYSGGFGAEFLALNHESSIFRQSSNPVCGFSMMEQVRLCSVWPTENWLGASLNQIQGWTTVQESYSRALDQGTRRRRRDSFVLPQSSNVYFPPCKNI